MDKNVILVIYQKMPNYWKPKQITKPQEHFIFIRIKNSHLGVALIWENFRMDISKDYFQYDFIWKLFHGFNLALINLQNTCKNKSITLYTNNIEIPKMFHENPFLYQTIITKIKKIILEYNINIKFKYIYQRIKQFNIAYHYTDTNDKECWKFNHNYIIKISNFLNKRIPTIDCFSGSKNYQFTRYISHFNDLNCIYINFFN